MATKKTAQGDETKGRIRANLQTGKRESRRQASEAQREKKKKTKETVFLLGEQYENFIAAVIK